MSTNLNIRDIMSTAPVIPVLVVEDPASAVPLANALVGGGLRVLEFTLRTPSALESIRAVADAVPDAIVGVGTVNDPEDMQRASDSGACFAVSPGFTPTLAEAAAKAGLPYLPGVASASEVLAARASQLTALKFFPAAQAGGPTMLKALQGPFADTVFCPTGGINATTATEWLSLSNVLCVGGSWVAPAELLQQKDWAGIQGLAEDATRTLTSI